MLTRVVIDSPTASPPGIQLLQVALPEPNVRVLVQLYPVLFCRIQLGSWCQDPVPFQCTDRLVHCQVDWTVRTFCQSWWCHVVPVVFSLIGCSPCRPWCNAEGRSQFLEIPHGEEWRWLEAPELTTSALLSIFHNFPLLITRISVLVRLWHADWQKRLCRRWQ